MSNKWNNPGYINCQVLASTMFFLGLDKYFRKLFINYWTSNVR